MDNPAIIVTCEHGGNRIPPAYRHLFADKAPLLNSHRGYDRGALAFARRAAARFNAPLFAATTSRLLVDLNRRQGHPTLFSEITRALDAPSRQAIIARYHRPHREQVRRAVAERIADGRVVLHIACHSFTPILRGRERSMDAALLYDPARAAEHHFCALWKQALAVRAPSLLVRRNAPYKGVSDGLATWLRTLFPAQYLGIELELNQRAFTRDRAQWRTLCTAVLESLEQVVAAAGSRFHKTG